MADKDFEEVVKQINALKELKQEVTNITAKAKAEELKERVKALDADDFLMESYYYIGELVLKETVIKLIDEVFGL